MHLEYFSSQGVVKQLNFLSVSPFRVCINQHFLNRFDLVQDGCVGCTVTAIMSRIQPERSSENK